MRIALALEFPLMQQGGTEVLVVELIRQLASKHEIVLVSGDCNRDALPVELRILIHSHIHWPATAKTAKAARKLAATLQQEKVHLVHFHFGGTFQWRSNRFWRCPLFHLHKTGIPMLSTNHLAEEWFGYGINPARPAWQKNLLQIFAILNRSIIYRHLQVEICVSQHDQERVIRMFPLFRKKIIQRYHSLLSAKTPPPDLQHREPIILCVGTIGGRKAQPNLAEGFARIAVKHPGWQLDFAGRIDQQNYAERIREIAGRWGVSDRIHLLGRIDDAEIVQRMERASIIAMPSLQEGLGLSLQEALFRGCVGVGSRAGGIPELIEHEVNGLLVPPGDIEALGAALDRLLSDDALLSKFRAETRASVLRKSMTSDAMVQNYLELYQKAVSGMA